MADAYIHDEGQAQFVSDQSAIGHDATTKEDRRAALDHCLENDWAGQDIGCIERIETTRRMGWKMYPYRAS